MIMQEIKGPGASDRNRGFFVPARHSQRRSSGSLAAAFAFPEESARLGCGGKKMAETLYERRIARFRAERAAWVAEMKRLPRSEWYFTDKLLNAGYLLVYVERDLSKRRCLLDWLEEPDLTH
jgi:hypothetical protein